MRRRSSNYLADFCARAGIGQLPSRRKVLGAGKTVEIKAISPNTGPAAGGTAVVISGRNFDGLSGVWFGGIAATSVSGSSTSITCTTPPHPSGLVPVRVDASAGAAIRYNGFGYDVIPPAADAPETIVSTPRTITVTPSTDTAEGIAHTFGGRGGVAPTGVVLCQRAGGVERMALLTFDGAVALAESVHSLMEAMEAPPFGTVPVPPQPFGAPVLSVTVAGGDITVGTHFTDAAIDIPDGLSPADWQSVNLVLPAGPGFAALTVPIGRAWVPYLFAAIDEACRRLGLSPDYGGA